MLKRHGLLGLFIVGAVGLAVWLFALGGSAQIALWAAAEQREVQTAMARALRAVHAGDPIAWATLLGLCFAYGFFHAAGPGHGKLVMGGYSLGRDIPRRRIVGLTLAASLGQSLTAIVLVSSGFLLFQWGREQMTDLADGPLQQFSIAAIMAVGLWLLFRGLRRFVRQKQTVAPADHHQHAHSHGHAHHHSCGHSHDHHHHTHSHSHVCESCGHAHAPSLEQMERATNLREAVAVVLSVAIRPCTGALFVLILTYGMGIWLAGVLGALVMGLGTAILTLTVALGAQYIRGGLSERLEGATGLRIMAGVEVAAGALVVLIAGQMLLRLT